MTRDAVERDIQAQPDALRQVIGHLEGPGRAAFEEAARALGQAQRVVVTGMGASFAAALPLALALQNAGRAAVAIEAGELLHAALPACRGALVVLVSRSGESVEVARLLEALPALGATGLGVTNVPGSPLAERATYPVLMGAPNDSMVALQTYVATVGTMLALAGSAGFAGPRAPAELAAAIPALAAAVTEGAASAEISDWKPPEGAAYLLGRGMSLASAVEGQLLFHEMSQAPAVAMTGHGFRHGPFEVIRPGFQAWLFRPDDALAPLNDALARDIATAGGTCHVIGPSLGGQALPPPLHLLVEVVPVQWAALRWAEHRGVDPGEFRWTAQVTRREDGLSKTEGRSS
jgi:glucosamine--fructose-6-phosphate aminotransferase (isomerizing)